MIAYKRTPTPPPSLAAGSSWREQDVLETLHNDFHGKCYLCERAHRRPTFEVDHFIPRHEDPNLCFDWDNLFPICESCNKRRDKNSRPGGYLNPCADDIATRLVQRLDLVAETCTCEFYAAMDGDRAAENSAEQLAHLHNTAHVKGLDLVEAIKTQLILALKEARAYERTSDRAALHRLRRFLSRSAPYTALIRSELAEYHHLFD